MTKVSKLLGHQLFLKANKMTALKVCTIFFKNENDFDEETGELAIVLSARKKWKLIFENIKHDNFCYLKKNYHEYIKNLKIC